MGGEGTTDGKGLLLLVFLTVPATMTSGSSSSTMVNKHPVKGVATSVMATTYPVSWSTYLMPMLKRPSVEAHLCLLDCQSSSCSAVPVFSGVEGDNIHLWILQVKLGRAQAGWDELTLMAQVLAALEGPAAVWLHTTEPDILFCFNCFKEELWQSFSSLS